MAVKKPQRGATTRKRKETIPVPFAEVGTTGLASNRGEIRDEFLPALQTTRGRRLYREMADNEPIIGACLGTIKQFMRSVSIRVRAFDDSEPSQRQADLVRTSLDDMSMTWSDTLTESLPFVYGWSALETVYKRRLGDQRDPARCSKYTDGLIGWRKHAPRSQETLDRWVLDDAGGVQAMIQDPMLGRAWRGGRVTIPIEKLLLFRTEPNRNNPEGRSLLRSAYVSYYHNKHVRFVEGVGVERDLAGYPVLYAPGEVADENATGDALTAHDEYKKILRNLRRDEQEGFILPSDRDDSGNLKYELKLLSAAGSRAFNTGEIIERGQKEEALALLCSFVLLGHEKVGSFSLASSKTGVFALAIAGWMDSLLAVWNRFAIPRLMRMNGMDLRWTPELTRGDIEAPDLAEVGQYVAQLAGAGAINPFAVDGLEDYLLSLIGFADTDDDVVGKRKAPTEEVRKAAARLRAALDAEAG